MRGKSLDDIPPCFNCHRNVTEKQASPETRRIARQNITAQAAKAAQDQEGVRIHALKPNDARTMAFASDAVDRITYGGSLMCGRTMGVNGREDWRYSANVHNVVPIAQPTAE